MPPPRWTRRRPAPSPSDTIDVLEAQDSGERLTHRVLAVVGAGTEAAGWNTSRPRAVAEPRLEAWAAAHLGDPSSIVVAEDGRWADHARSPRDSPRWTSSQLGSVRARTRAANRDPRPRRRSASRSNVTEEWPEDAARARADRVDRGDAPHAHRRRAAAAAGRPDAARREACPRTATGRCPSSRPASARSLPRSAAAVSAHRGDNRDDPRRRHRPGRGHGRRDHALAVTRSTSSASRSNPIRTGRSTSRGRATPGRARRRAASTRAALGRTRSSALPAGDCACDVLDAAQPPPCFGDGFVVVAGAGRRPSGADAFVEAVTDPAFAPPAATAVRRFVRDPERCARR